MRFTGLVKRLHYGEANSGAGKELGKTTAEKKLYYEDRKEGSCNLNACQA